MIRLGVKEKTRQFCFETAWFKHPKYYSKITEIWGREITTKNAGEMAYQIK
jgi:hypothetical protein